MSVLDSLCGVCFAPEDLEPFEGNCRVLVVALDYDYSPGSELTCTQDASFFVSMAQSAGVDDITVVTDKGKFGKPTFPIREEVLRNIREVGKRCEPGDFFIWFFAGHGVNVPDHDGDERDGFDEAFVTPTVEGKLAEKGVLVDDEFARALNTFIPMETKILCICDCCHSGTICDLDSFHWDQGRDIYQLSASQDNEEAEDTGEGGLLTGVLKKTIQKCTLKYGTKPYSLKTVAESCVKEVGRVTKEQEASFQHAGTDPAEVSWPLLLQRSDLLRSMTADLE
eukprot:gb/GFBE01002747.1/.p1 GENE.gb/GFBE01002747.1/~~gb/GFBE01002747.1/.p1  ORF type:complete len:281 (+),score=59.72 gb/GFBE01002747.1/:1-843(+)